MIEIWKNIKGHEVYQISNFGRVKSLSKSVRYVHAVSKIEFFRNTKEKILKNATDGNGYLFVSLSKDGRKFICRIHVLVAEHFIGDRPNKKVINHIDSNKKNNKYDNLEYVSKQRNTQHYYESIKKGLGRIPYKDIPIIIERINNGEEVFNISKEYNVSRNDISSLCKIVGL